MTEKVLKIISICLSVIAFVLGVMALIFFIKYNSIKPDYSGLGNGELSIELSNTQELKSSYRNLCVSFSLYLAILCIIISVVNLWYMIITNKNSGMKVR